MLKTNIGLNDNYYNGTFVASTCIHGKVVNIPCKAGELCREAKNHTVLFRGNWSFWKTHTLGGARELRMAVNISRYQHFPNGLQHPEHSPDNVHKDQHCWVADDENEAERSHVSCSVMVTRPGVNVDLLTPCLVISPLDVFLFSFENVDSLLERKIYKHYTFHCQKRGFVI